MKYLVSAAAIVAAGLAFAGVAHAADKPQIAFVVNGPSDFWKLAEAGVKKAQSELPDVELLFKYPERADAAVQQRMMDDLVAAGVKAIAVSVVSPATSTDAINKVAASVPVFTFDSDATQTNRIAYFGSSNVELGKMAGDLMKKALPNGGKCIGFVGLPGADNAKERIQGYNESVKGTGLELIDVRGDHRLLVVRDTSKLAHLEHMRRDFVANVSHELRTPLTVIHGYLEMLDADDNPEWATLLAEMRQQSQRMTRLVEDLLTLSRLDARDELPEERVAMQPLLASLAREAEALSGGRHRIVVEDSAGIDLRGSSRDLHSAFSNLLSNAVRYSPDGGEIVVQFLGDADGGTSLTVRDTGVGIPPEHLPRLTERFYRVSTSRSRDTGGTGLGLAIVKHVLGLHDATLDIESTLGAGSRFRCRFPRARILPRDAAAPVTIAPP